MIYFNESSVIYRSSLWAGNIYNNSTLKKVFTAIGSCFRNSITYKAFNNYLHRKSSYQYTITYRVLSAIGRFLDLLVGIIHDFFAKQIRTSLIIALFSNIKKEASSSTAYVLITAVLSLTAGYSVVNTFRNTWSTLKLEGVFAMCIVCIFIGIMSGKWKASVRNSLFIKLYHFIWE
ncbi:MAG TPA: hypothetical protein VHT34_08070 [Clostridia bacterium]|nr:hypothetical protein [Clostridia bacterium]